MNQTICIIRPFMRRSLDFRRVIQLFVLTLLIVSLQSKAGNPDTTRIIVMGTVHSSSDNFDSRKLADIIGTIKPDLILVELDSSFFTPEMTFKPETVKISLENKAVTMYTKDHPVPVRPYEIEGRNKIYQAHDYFNLQRELSKALNIASQDSLLVPEAGVLLDAIIRFDEIAYSLSLDRPMIFNSESSDKAMESKQYYDGEGLTRIVALTPSLAKYSEFCKFKHDFWITRNDAMVSHIMSRVSEFHPKTMLVLCGFEHRYYLRNALMKQSRNNSFLLREYWLY